MGLAVFFRLISREASLTSVENGGTFSGHVANQIGQDTYQFKNGTNIRSSSFRQGEDASDGGSIKPQHAASNRNVEIPLQYNSLKDVIDPPSVDDVPYFWHVPRSGGSTVKDIMGKCLSLVLASNVGDRDDSTGTDISVVRYGDIKFVDIDITTTEGIVRAQHLELVPRKFAEVIVTPQVCDGCSLFNPDQKGRMFAMFRHPVERAISLFYAASLSNQAWTEDYNLGVERQVDFEHLHEFLTNTQNVENNWMTRALINKMKGLLDLEDLDRAKEILRRKCLVGLMSQKEVSIDRFHKYFGWKGHALTRGGIDECEERLLHWGWANLLQHPQVEKGSAYYEEILLKNEFDMEVYEYATELFEEQSSLFDAENKFWQKEKPALNKNNVQASDDANESTNEENGPASNDANESTNEENGPADDDADESTNKDGEE